jgi:hypothetical protein
VARIKQDLRSLLEMLSAPRDKARADAAAPAPSENQAARPEEKAAAAGERGSDAGETSGALPAGEGTEGGEAEQATASSGGRDEAAAASSKDTSRWPPERGGEPDAGASGEASDDLPLNGHASAPEADGAKPARKPRKSARSRTPRG